MAFCCQGKQPSRRTAGRMAPLRCRELSEIAARQRRLASCARGLADRRSQQLTFQHASASKRWLSPYLAHQRACAAGVGHWDGAPLAQQADQLVVNAQLRAVRGWQPESQSARRLAAPPALVAVLTWPNSLRFACQPLCWRRRTAHHNASHCRLQAKHVTVDACGTALPPPGICTHRGESHPLTPSLPCLHALHVHAVHQEQQQHTSRPVRPSPNNPTALPSSYAPLACMPSTSTPCTRNSSHDSARYASVASLRGEAGMRWHMCAWGG